MIWDGDYKMGNDAEVSRCGPVKNGNLRFFWIAGKTHYTLRSRWPQNTKTHYSFPLSLSIYGSTALCWALAAFTVS
jgi:hypothetical protein